MKTSRFTLYLSGVMLSLVMIVHMAAASPAQSAAFDEGFSPARIQIALNPGYSVLY
jgi:hypothetical protein